MTARRESPNEGSSFETWSRRWSRRTVSIPLYVLLAIAFLGLTPLLLTVAFLVDLVRGHRFATVRCLLFFGAYLWCEVAGIVGSLLVWAFWGHNQTLYLERNFQLQCWWARTLFDSARRSFGFVPSVENQEAVQAGPFILFIRHTSVGDTLLPAVFVADQSNIRLRWVLKAELLWDPCLDLVGNRLPNCFVRRGTENSEKQVAIVSSLAEKLGKHDAVVIYPEGTRFSEEKRQRILEKIASIHPELIDRAAKFREVLPPKLGGTMALLNAAPPCDIVFCAHTGFEGAASFVELLRGALVGKRIQLVFRRFNGADLPGDHERRIAWFYDRWAEVDQWVIEHRNASNRV